MWFIIFKLPRYIITLHQHLDDHIPLWYTWHWNRNLLKHIGLDNFQGSINRQNFICKAKIMFESTSQFMSFCSPSLQFDQRIPISRYHVQSVYKQVYPFLFRHQPPSRTTILKVTDGTYQTNIFIKNINYYQN